MAIFFEFYSSQFRCWEISSCVCHIAVFPLPPHTHTHTIDTWPLKEEDFEKRSCLILNTTNFCLCYLFFPLTMNRSNFCDFSQTVAPWNVPVDLMHVKTTRCPIGANNDLYRPRASSDSNYIKSPLIRQARHISSDSISLFSTFSTLDNTCRIILTNSLIFEDGIGKLVAFTRCIS